jgi:hypothetical protein
VHRPDQDKGSEQAPSKPRDHASAPAAADADGRRAVRVQAVTATLHVSALALGDSCLFREGLAEPLEHGVGIAGSPCFGADHAGVAGLVQGGGDRGVVDLPRAGFAAAGTSATWISPTQSMLLRMSSMRFPSPIWAW